MSAKDIRWIQRFNNFTKAYSQLKDAVLLARQRELTKLEAQGLIKAFEFTHELAWNTLKDFLVHRGVLNLYGSKDSTRAAFQAGLIHNGEVWMNMISSRNLTSHTHNEAVAKQIIAAIQESYFSEFEALLSILNERKGEEEA